MKKFLPAIILLLSFQSFFARSNGPANDSLKSDWQLHLGVSLIPIFNWMHPIDSNSNIFNSPIQYEAQVSFRRHYFVLGFNYSKTQHEYTANNLDFRDIHSRFSFYPSYQYKIVAMQRWTVFAGLSFLYEKKVDDNWMITPLEIITRTYTYTTKGIAPYIRLNYRFNKNISLETETAYYIGKSTNQYIENYPLTPSLGDHWIYYDYFRRFSLPSNILLKISF
jgi:hypothetical protein